MIPLEKFFEKFEEYYRAITSISKQAQENKRQREAQKMHTFMRFIEEVTGLRPEEYEYDAFIIKGRPDAVVGNLVIEFEDNLEKSIEREEAKEQLKKYAKELKEKFGTNKFYGLASDGIIFILYKIEVSEKGDVKLDLVKEFKISRSKEDTKRFYYFIFQYFFSERFTRKATPENIVALLGYDSRVFNETFKVLKEYWNKVKHKTNVKILFDQWSKYYMYVTGEELKDENLFLRHTYLVILTKFLVYFFLEREKSELGNVQKCIEVLSGDIFRRHNLYIFDKDFYSWVLDEDIKEDMLWDLHDVLLKELLSFDFSELNTDILKEIYQNIIERDERAALGEYYTPDFIAEKIVRELLEKKPEGKILDPACGSGTFLFIAIKVKKELLSGKMSPERLAEHILNSVVGIDINPVAVIMARANYLLAIKDLLPFIRRTLRIPVYLANALTLHDRTERDPVINIYIHRIQGLEDGEYFILPADKKILDKIGLDRLDSVVEISEKLVGILGEDVTKTEEVTKYAERLVEQELECVYASGKFERLDKETKKILTNIAVRNAQLLWKYVKENKDTFWCFVLKNTYKPLFYKGMFDFVVGNPPWVTYGEVSIEKFRNDLRRILTQYGMPLGGLRDINNLDIAQAFILHGVHFYLRKEGELYFVVPHSFINGRQYTWMRSEPNLLKIYKIVDLSELKINGKGIFNVPCCLVKIRKTSKKEEELIEGEYYKGNIVYVVRNIKTRNVPYEVFVGLLREGKIEHKEGVYIKAANNTLVFTEQKVTCSEITNENIVDILTIKSNDSRYHSPYLNIVNRGVDTSPRVFTFVLIEKPKYVFNPTSIAVKTHPRAVKKGKGGTHSAKKKYTTCIEGSVPSEYLYCILTSDSSYPFGVWNLSIGVLPLKVDYTNNRFVILSRETAFRNVGDWYRKLSEHYNPTDISKVFSRIKQVIPQKPKAWTVVYNTSGDSLNLGSVVINREEVLEKANKSLKEQLGVDIDTRILQAIVIDCTNYYIDFNTKEEAHYVCAMLQSKWVREATNNTQTKGVKGPRDICDRPFYFPIPKFSEKSPYYEWMLELAKLSEKAHQIVEPVLQQEMNRTGIPFVNNTEKFLSQSTVGAIRRKIRNVLEQKGIQSKIDEISYELLKNVLKQKPNTVPF